MTPSLALLALLATTGSLAAKLYAWLIERAGGLATHGTAGSIGLWITKVLVALALVVVAFVVSVVFVPAVSAPFMDRIAARLRRAKVQRAAVHRGSVALSARRAREPLCSGFRS